MIAEDVCVLIQVLYLHLVDVCWFLECLFDSFQEGRVILATVF